MGKTTTDWIINADPAQSSLAGLISDVEKYNATVGKSAEASKQAFQKSANATASFNKELATNSRNYRLIEGEVRKIVPLFNQASKAQKQFSDPADIKKLQAEIDSLKKKINETKKGLDDTSKSGGIFKNMLSGIGGQLAGLASIGAIIGIGKEIFDVTAQFQKFEAVLTNTLGSNSAAQRAMLMIQDFAAKTPYSVAELTDAYVKFANRGLKLTNKEMTAFGDLAASTGKSFDQLTEAALDALTGENERLKEFGIIARKNGETTAFTFKGVTKEVKNTDTAIREYLLSLGEVEGVSGSMAAISETLTGKVSNLGDSFDKLFLTLGNQQTGVLGSTISLINGLVNSITFLISTTDRLGKEQSAAAVTKYADEITIEFKKIADEAKKAGKDVKEALDFKGFGMESALKEQLLSAEKQLKEIRAFRGDVATQAGELLDYTGFEKTKNKSIEASIAADVERLKGQLQAIQDAKVEALKPPKDSLDAEAAKAAEKAAKAAAAARKKALAEYQKELEALEKQAAKARLELLEKNSAEYYAAALAENLKGIDKIRTDLLKASKAAGKGGNLTEEQKAQFGLLEEAALKEYYDNIAKLQEVHDDKMLDLEKDSAEKQIAQITRRYDKEIAAAKKAKDGVLAAQLEKAKGLEIAEATLAQNLKKNATDEELAISQIEGGKFVTDSFKPVAIEKAKQQAILDVQIEYAKKRLALLELTGGEENQIAIQNLKNLIAKLSGEKEKGPIRGKFDILKMMGVAEEDRSKVEDAFADIISAGTEFMNSYIQQQVEMADRAVEEKQRAVEDKRDELDQEIELSKAGFASNVETKRQELEVLKQQREEALKEQIKAQKLQNAQNAVSQINSLITAGAKIFEVTAALNIVPGVGLAIAGGLITGMFALMQSMKGKAAAVTKYEQGGWIKGNRHSSGGEKYYGQNGAVMELEDGEHVTKRTAAGKNRDWLEAINAMDETRMNELAFERLLKGTGVIPAKNLPKKVKQLAERSSEFNRGNNAYDYKRLEEKLDKIAKNTGREERLETEDKTIITRGTFTRVIHKKK